MKKRFSNGYTVLLETLHRHPEFSAFSDNFGDSEVVALGTKLWRMWGENEQDLPFDATGIPTTIEECGYSAPSNTLKYQIACFALEGLNYIQVADKLKKNKQDVQNTFRDFGFSTVVEIEYPFSKEELEEQVKSGISLNKLSKKYKTTSLYMKRALEHYGLQIMRHSHSNRFTASKQTIQTHYRRQGTLTKTALYFGVSLPTLRNRMKQLGIYKKDSRGGSRWN